MKNVSKKLAMVLMVALLTVVMAACGNSESAENSATNEEGLKIAIVTSMTGVDDGNFNEDNYNGILNFIKNNPTASVKAIKEETGIPVKFVGLGEKEEDLETFDIEKYIYGLFKDL